MSSQSNKPYFMILIATIGMTSLIGCQTNIVQPSKTTTDSKMVALKNVPKPQLLERLTYYDWELTQVKNAGGKTAPFYHQPPLIMTVAPDRLLFNEGCHHYHVFIDDTYKPAFPYRFSNFKTGLSNSCQNDDKSEIQLALERLFAPYGDTAFTFEPLSKSPSHPTIALSIKDSATLIFSGTKKPEHSISGIPITHELLQRYEWRLVSAIDRNQNKIDNFYQPDIPIKASFSAEKHRQQFGMSVGRHGISGTYALAPNQTLLTASDPSPAISFGERLDSIWLEFIRTALSPSQLILNKQPSTDLNTKPSQSQYILTQKTEKGDTLIWQSEPKKSR